MTASAGDGMTFSASAAVDEAVARPRPARDAGRSDPVAQAYIASVYASHRRALRAFVARFLSNDDDIADTVQDVFVRIVQLCDPCRIERNPRAYLFSTAHHLVVDRIRQARSRRQESHVCFDDVELTSATPAPDDALYCQQVLACLSDELRRTGKQVAAVLELSCTEDLTHAQIARELGVTTRTVERHMREARAVIGGLLASDAAAVVARRRSAC